MSASLREQDTGGGRAAVEGEYARRLAARRAEANRRVRLDRTTSNLRLLVFATGVGAAILAFGADAIRPAWLALPAAVFVVLVIVHDRMIRARRRAERAVEHYELGLARLRNEWVGRGNTGEAFADPEHPYAADLDLFGRGSLFERLCTVRTQAAERILASWLLSPATPPRVRSRQQALEELRDAVDLREDLALLGEEVRDALHPETLRVWGEAPPALRMRGARLAATALSGCSVAALGAWAFTGAGPLPFQIALLAQTAFALTLRMRVRGVLATLELPASDLGRLSALLERLERESFRAEHLTALREALETEGVAPSRRIAQLGRLVDLLDARRNQFFAPIGALLLWSTQIAFAIEHWRAVCGSALAPWLESVGELEVLACLAGYAYENPDHVFPDVREAEGPGAERRFEAEALGHPLLPPDRCVRNDVAFVEPLRVVVVSGSNMSGKSTLLRTVGANTVLALAGIPVCAKRLRLTPFAVGASIRIHDSLLEGSSRFYGEIRRLRQVMEIAEGERPLLFLLDEILHGTNSHDRGIGAEAVVRGLLARGAIGLVTTHDLALARVADALAPRAANVHFADHLESGRIVFDYRMREGVVRKSNALELMRAVGLEV